MPVKKNKAVRHTATATDKKHNHQATPASVLICTKEVRIELERLPVPPPPATAPKRSIKFNLIKSEEEQAKLT